MRTKKPKCSLCKKELDNPKDRTSLDCGGDCVQCMAEAGDPSAIAFMERLKREEVNS